MKREEIRVYYNHHHHHHHHGGKWLKMTDNLSPYCVYSQVALFSTGDTLWQRSLKSLAAEFDLFSRTHRPMLQVCGKGGLVKIETYLPNMPNRKNICGNFAGVQIMQVTSVRLIV